MPFRPDHTFAAHFRTEILTMALSDLCADFLAFLDDDPAPRLVKQRLDAMAAEAGTYSGAGYGPELDALRGLITIARAGPGQPSGLLVLMCEVVRSFHDTWPGDEPAESERQALMDALSAEVLAELSAHRAGAAPGDGWDARAQALLGMFTSRVEKAEARIAAERGRLGTRRQS